MSTLSELLKPIADRLREYLGTVEKIKPSEFASKIDEAVARANNDGYHNGLGDGKREEYEDFWNTFQNNGARTKYSYAFYEWQDETLAPLHNILCYGGSNFMYRAFYNSNIKTIAKPIIVSGGSSQGQIFANAINLESVFLIDITEYTSTFTDWFLGCSKLKSLLWNGSINQNLDMSDCQQLNGDSIYDTITHLYKSASGKTLTLSQTAVNNAVFPNGMTWDEVKALRPGGFTISLI